MCQRSTCSGREIFVDIRRGILEERCQTSYHVRKLQNGNGWLFLCDTWLRYLKKLQLMLTATRQISNLRNQDVSKEILLYFVRTNFSEFSDKFSISSIFFICHSFFYYANFFPLKGKLKYIIIHFPYEISNEIT